MTDYMVFAGKTWYALGGVFDCQGTYDNIDEALEIATSEDFDWYHIVNLKTFEIVAQSENQAYGN